MEAELLLNPFRDILLVKIMFSFGHFSNYLFSNYKSHAFEFKINFRDNYLAKTFGQGPKKYTFGQGPKRYIFGRCSLSAATKMSVEIACEKF